VGAAEARRARAFAPGHLTGAFRPGTEARDPRARGSVGVGLVLDVGVWASARWHPADRPTVTLRSDAHRPLGISTEVARRLLAHRPGRLHVELRHDLPIGQGMGTSAAGATATALAVAGVVGVDRPTAVATAHLAELFGGGGLGGVAAILGGGLEVRLRPGIPAFGRVVRSPFPDPVLVAVVGGPIASPRVLSSPRALAQISAAYASIGAPEGRLTPDEFWAAAEQFTDRVALAPPRVRSALRAMRRRGARAAQAMFGRTVFCRLPSGARRDSLLDWVRRAGWPAVELGVPSRGARRLPGELRA